MVDYLVVREEGKSVSSKDSDENIDLIEEEKLNTFEEEDWARLDSFK